MINASDLNGNLELLRRGIEENQNLLQDILFEGGEGAYDGRYILRNGDTGIGDLSFGTAGSITQLDFRGVNVLASADPAPNGIATVSILLNQSLDSLDVSGIATVS